jgi:hypothetical protein
VTEQLDRLRTFVNGNTIALAQIDSVAKHHLDTIDALTHAVVDFVNIGINHGVEAEERFLMAHSLSAKLGAPPVTTILGSNRWLYFASGRVDPLNLSMEATPHHNVLATNEPSMEEFDLRETASSHAPGQSKASAPHPKSQTKRKQAKKAAPPTENEEEHVAVPDSMEVDSSAAAPLVPPQTPAPDDIPVVVRRARAL